MATEWREEGVPQERSTTLKPKLRTVLFFDHTAVLGGGEIALLNLAQRLDRNRYIPVVVLSSEGPLQDELIEAGIETHVIPLAPSVVHARKDHLSWRSLLRLRDLLYSLSYCYRLARFIKHRRADLLHTNSLKADILGGIAARLVRVPVVWHIRDRIDDDYLPPKVVQVFRYLCRILPNYIIANSAATLETLRLPRHESRMPAIKGTVVHSGITAGASRNVRGNRQHGYVVHDGVISQTPGAARVDYPGGNSGAPTSLIGIVGRISPWKGQHVFVEAAAAVRAQSPNARFQIIGSALFGEEAYENEVRALATAHGLDEVLEWTGFRTDVAELIRELDVLVHASTSGEPFGQVVVEGMVAGKPVVATNGGGIPEIVQDGVTGLLVPMGDVAALTCAMARLLANPEVARAMGQAARQRVLEHFTIERTVEKVESIYEELWKRG